MNNKKKILKAINRRQKRSWTARHYIALFAMACTLMILLLVVLAK